MNVKNKVEFKQEIDSGYCLTKCPYGRDCMVNSVECTKCIHHYGATDTILKCTGHRRGPMK